MKKGFWDTLEKPFFALAPMADVTDAPFRRLIAKYGKPDVMWTEFVSADGLCLADEEGKEKLMHDLIFVEEERPIVAQFFTAKPEMAERVGALARELGFDGVDINMGCPDRTIEKQGAGAALMKDPILAGEIIEAVKKGAGDLPVSIKTRLGFHKDELDTWLPELLKHDLAAITIHARTRKELSKVPARWDRIKRAVEIRDECKSETLIIGNGDVLSLEDAREKAKESGCDGVMLGRAIFGNPWKFDKTLSFEDIPLKEKLQVLVEHSKLFEELLPHKSFAVMKKHYKAYVSGWDGAKELRMELMECDDAGEVKKIVEKYLSWCQ